MLFTVQAYLEDYIARQNLRDTDGYAVHLANLYFHQRSSLDEIDFLRRMKRMRTVFFAVNSIRARGEFEQSLLERLDRRFKKKVSAVGNPGFPGGTTLERKQLAKLNRRTVMPILQKFKEAMESRCLSAFWLSRTKGVLRKRPEEIAQTLLVMFIAGTLGNRGVVLREIYSGTGFVDVGISFTSPIVHLIELKVLRTKFIGPDQLDRYMKFENRPNGYMVVIDTAPASNKQRIPEIIRTTSGVIKIIRVDVNPVPPSKIN